MSELYSDFIDNQSLKFSKLKPQIVTQEFGSISGLKYNTLACFICVAPNGGYIALTADRSNPLSRDKVLREFVVVHRNDGQQIASLDMHSFGWIVGIEFLENHSLAIVYSDGLYFIYTPATKALSPKLYLSESRELDGDPIRGVRCDGKNLVYMTEKRVLYVRDLFTLGGSACKLYPITVEKLPLDESTCYNFSLLPARGSRLLQVFIPTKLGGLIKITNSTQPREETLLSGFSEPIINTSVSPSGDNVAVLTSTRKLYVLATNTYGNPGLSWTREITPSELDEFDFTSITKLEWIGQFAVALVCTQKIFAVSCKPNESVFDLVVKKASMVDIPKYTFFSKSEIDGLRVFIIGQGSKDLQICSLSL